MLSRDDSRFFVLAGPTASGKSEIAVRVAELCGGEIVGADAFQVYEGLDILTAKPGPELRARIPHHCVGTVPLMRRFDVAQFVALAHEAIAEIAARGKLPIVCGGTGFYVRALLQGLADLPAADAHLRAELEAQSIEDLQERLTNLDPIGSSQIDLNNPRRLIRALEVCLLTGQPFSSFRRESPGPDAPKRGVLLQRPRNELHQRIAARTAAMFTAGIEDEVKAVVEIGPTAEQAIGFREVRELNAGKRKRDDCIAGIEEATRQYAKRQMTWFRREPALELVEISASTDMEVLAVSMAERAGRFGLD
jgi:tRNA dimethylallyltransferase